MLDSSLSLFINLPIVDCASYSNQLSSSSVVSQKNLLLTCPCQERGITPTSPRPSRESDLKKTQGIALALFMTIQPGKRTVISLWRQLTS